MATIAESPTAAQLDEQRLAVPVCPTCGAPLAPRLRVIVQRVRQAAKRPALPELLLTCRCGALYVIGVAPETGR